MRILFTLIISIILLKGFSQKNSSQFYEKNDSINLYAFIGEKISVVEFKPDKISEHFKVDPITHDTVRWKSILMDVAFKVKYKVIQPVYNDLQIDTLDFEAYDHWGRPDFENHKYVIMYVSKSSDGTYYHQKYQYDAVVKNSRDIWKGKNGRSIKRLFLKKKKGVFKARGIFD